MRYTMFAIFFLALTHLVIGEKSCNCESDQSTLHVLLAVIATQLLVMLMVVVQTCVMRPSPSSSSWWRCCRRGANPQQQQRKVTKRVKPVLGVEEHPMGARVRVTYLGEGDVYYSVIPATATDAATAKHEEAEQMQDIENDMYGTKL